MDYDEISRTVQRTRYQWVRKGGFYYFIHRETGRLVCTTRLLMAYDTDEDMCGIDEDGRVICLNPDGSVNAERLRQMVIHAGGYLALCNHDRHIEHVIDVYGNILNI